MNILDLKHDVQFMKILYNSASFQGYINTYNPRTNEFDFKTLVFGSIKKIDANWNQDYFTTSPSYKIKGKVKTENGIGNIITIDSDIARTIVNLYEAWSSKNNS